MPARRCVRTGARPPVAGSAPAPSPACAAQTRCPERADSTAASTSAGDACWTSAIGLPVAGLTVRNVSSRRGVDAPAADVELLDGQRRRRIDDVVGHLVDHVTHGPSVRCAGATAILRRHRYRQRRRRRAGDGAPPRRRRGRRHRRRRRQRAPRRKRCRTRCTRSSCAGRRLPCTSARPPRWSSCSRPPSTSTVSTAWATSGCSCQGANRPTSTPSTPCSMRRTNTPGTLTLVTLGPLTNVARALQRDPTLPERIARCVVMGAVADHVGNTNPVAEFNMWVDPHAVDVVLRSGLAIEFVGMGHLAALRGARSDRRRRHSRDRHAAGRVLHRHPRRRERVRAARDQARRIRSPRSDRDGLRDRPDGRRPRHAGSTARSRPRAPSPAAWS